MQRGVIKRIRQACANCRRRKTKCSGERPVCAPCHEMRRSCIYEPYEHSWARPMTTEIQRNKPPGFPVDPWNSLLHRISSIEETLHHLDQQSVSNGAIDTGFSNTSTIEAFEAREDTASNPGFWIITLLDYPLVGDALSDVDQKPSLEEWQSLIHAYFQRFHNKPYHLVSEDEFMERLDNGSLPNCLLLAVLGLAVRYVDAGSLFHLKRHAISLAFSRQSWKCIADDDFDHVACSLTTVQSVALLALIDYTAGRFSTGWLRLGVAIRLCQDMDLTSEPCLSLPSQQQEHRRRIFWSIYIIDRLMACCRSRPAAIVDHNCLVRLPGASNFLISQIRTCKGVQSLGDDGMSLTVVVSSVLQRCAQYVHGISKNEEVPLWHPSSDFSETRAALYLVEAQLQVAALSQDSEQLLPRALFHLACCLLGHPLPLRSRLGREVTSIPASFIAQSQELSLMHARKLTDLLVEIQDKKDDPVDASCLIYCGAAAASIHLLAMTSNKGYDAQCYFDSTLRFIEELGTLWPIAELMTKKLIRIRQDIPQRQDFFDMDQPLLEPFTFWERLLWPLTDLGVQESRSQTEPSPKSWTNEVVQDDFELLFGSVDPHEFLSTAHIDLEDE